MKYHKAAPLLALAVFASAAAAQTPSSRCGEPEHSAQDPQRSMQDPSRMKQDSAVAAAPAARPTQSFVAHRLCLALQGIDLSADQRARLDIVRERFAARLAGITSDSALTMEQRRTLGEHDAEVRGVLTAEQQLVWDRNVAAMRVNVSRVPPE